MLPQDEMQKVKNDALLAVLARESQLEADLTAKAAQARRQAEEMKLAAAALAEANERDRKEAWEEKLQQEAELLRSVPAAIIPSVIINGIHSPRSVPAGT